MPTTLGLLSKALSSMCESVGAKEKGKNEMRRKGKGVPRMSPKREADPMLLTINLGSFQLLSSILSPLTTKSNFY